jgi:hypothetical protein
VSLSACSIYAFGIDGRQVVSLGGDMPGHNNGFGTVAKELTLDVLAKAGVYYEGQNDSRAAVAPGQGPMEVTAEDDRFCHLPAVPMRYGRPAVLGIWTLQTGTQPKSGLSDG